MGRKPRLPTGSKHPTSAWGNREGGFVALAAHVVSAPAYPPNFGLASLSHSPQ